MWSKDQIDLVKERLDFLEQLITAKEHFRGHDKIIEIKEDRSWTHPYKHYDALRIYLLLTCFDILGQPNNWKDFNSWLVSRKTKEERERVSEKHADKDSLQYVQAIFQEYNKIYGVKNSFIKFIREVLSEENRNKLFDSIKCSKQISPRILNPESTTIGTAKGIEVETEVKEKFLLEIRNSFTHKGISIGNPAGGVFDNEEPFYLPGKTVPTWGFSGILKKTIKEDTIIFAVRRWPFVLLEVVQDTLREKSL